MNCCSGDHPWDLYKVPTNWFPLKLRCFIIGENPGNVGSPYFYDGTQSVGHDPVAVRRNLLFGLHKVGLIGAPTLQAFQQAGFLFDHAIRCHLPTATIREERRLADRYDSLRAAAATHLDPMIKTAPAVWVMGRIARNAVASICLTFPKDRAPIAKPPYPLQIHGVPKFFVSRYLTRINTAEVLAICCRFKAFLNQCIP
jgi:hypothetical protein